MKFDYQPSCDFGEPLCKRLGNYPKTADITWDFFRWFGGWFSVLFVRIQFKLQVTGHVPKEHRVAVVANHQSHLDTPILLSALPFKHRKNLMVLAAEDYFFKTTSKALLASLLCQGVAFDRMHWRAIKSWYQHLKHLKTGWILFYPSGSRHSKEIHSGLLKLLIKEGWTVLPARVNGTELAWPSHSKFWRPFQRLSVKFFEPYRGQNLDELLNKLKRELYLL
ncbi:MAG: lysophospholipid acyltransferase family protein [Vampirovibrionales bacterium]|nr:lysophospholipid acyltransferase family protein [Vampirovibrionales bacterium]